MIKFRNNFKPFNAIYRQLLWHCSSLQIFNIPIFKISWSFICVKTFEVFVISSYISINIVAFSSSIHFSTITDILLSVKKYNFLWIIFKVACQIFWKFSKKLLLTVMYCFEHANQDIFLHFLFQSFYRFFFCPCDLHQCYFAHLGDFKKSLFLKVIMLHWNIPNHACIQMGKHLFATIK